MTLRVADAPDTGRLVRKVINHQDEYGIEITVRYTPGHEHAAIDRFLLAVPEVAYKVLEEAAERRIADADWVYDAALGFVQVAE